MGTKARGTFFNNLEKSLNLKDLCPYMGKFTPFSPVFSCFYRNFIQNSYLRRAIEPFRVKLKSNISF